VITALGEAFFSLCKLPSNKNKAVDDLSSMAKEFFKIFLVSKGRFVQPEAQAYMRAYNMEDDDIGEWDTNVWQESTKTSLKMAIMDFQNIPGIINKLKSSDAAPYYENFLGTLETIVDPEVTDPNVWLWICGEKEVELGLCNYIRVSPYGKMFTVH
jgi:hypothetical protein